MSLSGFPEVKWIYIRSFGIVDSPEYKELVVPTPLLIQPDRQGFSYANPADRNRSPNAELSNHSFEFSGAGRNKKSLDLALNCNDTFPVRRLGYDYDPGVRETLRMQHPDAAVL